MSIFEATDLLGLTSEHVENYLLFETQPRPRELFISARPVLGAAVHCMQQLLLCGTNSSKDSFGKQRLRLPSAMLQNEKVGTQGPKAFCAKILQ